MTVTGSGSGGVVAGRARGAIWSVRRRRKEDPFVSSFLKAQETGPYGPAIKPSERAFQFVGLMEVCSCFRSVAGIAVVAGEGTDPPDVSKIGASGARTNEFSSATHPIVVIRVNFNRHW